MKPKILIVEHDSTNMELIHNELIKSNINYTSEIVQTKKSYVKALHDFKPDIILSNYTFPEFDGPAAFKIKEKILPQTPFIFVSESVGEEIAIELIKNGVSNFVLNGNLSTLKTKINRALKEASDCKLSFKNKQKEEKRIEELGYYAQKYYSLIESSMDAILVTVKDGQILSANTAACEIFQMTQKEICGSIRSDVVDITDQRLQPLLEERNKTGIARGELTFKRKDGSKFPGEITSVVFIDTDGQEKTSMNIRDISKRKQAESALKQSEKKYRQIVETSQEGIWVIDEKNKTTFVNKKMEEILEYSQQEMMGKEISFFMDEEGKQLVARSIIRKKKEQSGQRQFKYIAKSGKEIWANVASNSFIDNNGVYKGNMAMVTDITERKKNKEKLEQLNIELALQNEEKENRAAELTKTNIELLKTNRELDRFVYSVSHDLRSPLTSILGLISFIEEESLEVDTLEHIAMIKNSVNRLDEFIKNILSYSRNNRTGLDIVQIPLQKTTNEIVNSLRSIKEAEGILFEIDIKEQQPFYSDRLRLNTLLENLISNAIKYHKTDQSDSFIKIIGHSDQDKLLLSIIDNGIGIATEYHDKIFEMFYRLSNKKNGSGIGLYIVKDTIQILQGSIQINSEKGIGTTFNITLKNLKP